MTNTEFTAEDIATAERIELEKVARWNRAGIGPNLDRAPVRAQIIDFAGPRKL